MSLAVRTCPRIFSHLAMLLTIGLWLVTDTLGHELFGGAQRDMTAGASQHEGARIDSIIVSNRNVFDLSDPRFNRFPFKTANKLHLVTRRSVIERELLLKVGDPFLRELAEETARNLRTRLALYDAWVETESLPDGRLLVRVVTIDQWSLIIFARLAREANLTNIRFGFEERNLLGRNQLFSLEYFIEEGKKNHVNMVYGNSRFMGRSVKIGASYDSDPSNELKKIAVSHPYYNLQQLLSWSASLDHAKVRTDDPANGRSNFTTSDQSQLSLGSRWGTYHEKIGVTGEYLYRSSSTYASTLDHSDSIVTPPFDSAFHRLMLYSGAQSIRYVGMKRINGFNYTEDIEMGLSATIGLGRAFARHWDTYLFDQLALQIGSVQRLGRGLLMLSYERVLWFPKDAPVLQSASMSFRFYETSLSYATLALRAQYRSEQRDAALYLGGTSGVRGYDRNYKAGDRLLVTNTEARLYPGLELLSVQFGGVLFVDAGRAYRPEEPFSLKNLIVSVGAGLRISFERASRSELARIDFAHTRVPSGQDGRLKSVWQLLIGHGQYF